MKYTDCYLQPDAAYNRLENEFKKYGKLIIAVDYDDTLYDFHKKGRTYNDVINLLKRWEPYSEVIIFTGNGKDTYPQITEYLNENNVTFKGINCQSSVPNKNLGKVYANVYLDDRIGLRQVFNELTKLITKIENKEVIPNGC